MTRILGQIQQGDPHAAEQLLPLVYDELRKLAAEKMANERPGQTLQATALVHEAYLRLVDVKQAQRWNSRGHFFAAAAEAMRRILVESARRKRTEKHGGGLRRLNLDKMDALAAAPPEDLLAFDGFREAALRGLLIDPEVLGEPFEVALLDDDALVRAAVGGTFRAVVERLFRSRSIGGHAMR